MATRGAMRRLRRLARMVAVLRVHLRYAAVDHPATCAGLDAELDQFEAELAAMADEAMTQTERP